MQGPLRKMQVNLENPVQYHLPLGNQTVGLNPLIGKPVALKFTGSIYCIHCNRATKKSFNQGYCYPCFIKLAQCDICIVKPETCHFAAGTCREPEWGETFCFQPHYVYLANSSGIKVGITRQSQIPVRWIDQGAVQAAPIIKVSSRHLSGLAEVIIGKHVSDKTSWQRILKNQIEKVDLQEKRDSLLTACESELNELRKRFGEAALEVLSKQTALEIHYPVDSYPVKINAFNFDKKPLVSGMLQGIKGQYLIFDTCVINIRKFAGYEVELSV